MPTSPIRALTSTTAVAMCLSLASPLPVLAQSDEARPFPCVAPTGAVAANPAELAAELMRIAGNEAQTGGTGPADVQLCSARSIQRGIDRGGEDLQAAIAGAPQEVQDQLIALGAAGAPGQAGQTPPPQAEEPAEQAAEAADPAQPEAQEQTAETAPEQPAEEPADQAATAAPEQPEDPAPQTAETTPEQPAAEQSAESTDAPVSEAPAADTPVAEAPAADPSVGEAGQKKLTDAERQARAEKRAARREAAAAAALAEKEANGATAQAESDAPEVQTRTVTEDDVRRAEEDFDTAVNETVAAPEEDDERFSTFEKALLLGLGAAVVGSVLDNGDEVVSNSGDRVVVERDGELKVLKNDDQLLAQPGAQVQSQTFQDGSTRETISYEDGRQVITVRGADGTVLRRSLIRAEDGEEVVLFDDTQQVDPIDFSTLPQTTAAKQTTQSVSDQQALEAALQAAIANDVNRRFSLQQVRDYKQVRALAPEVELDAVTFATGSAAIQPSQAEALSALGLSMRDIIAQEPDSVFLIEGHTDAVGSAVSNLALSDRRAETVALALTQYFDVPPQNLITQGYGETDLKVQVLTDERANRRAAVRNISGLLY